MSQATVMARLLQATERWLSEIGLPFDDLHCSSQKIARCRELDIELLIDDSPANLLAAIDHGMLAATIFHPWNRELCEEEDIVCAQSWPELKRRLQRRDGAQRRARSRARRRWRLPLWAGCRAGAAKQRLQ